MMKQLLFALFAVTMLAACETTPPVSVEPMEAALSDEAFDSKVKNAGIDPADIPAEMRENLKKVVGPDTKLTFGGIDSAEQRASKSGSWDSGVHNTNSCCGSYKQSGSYDLYDEANGNTWDHLIDVFANVLITPWGTGNVWEKAEVEIYLYHYDQNGYSNLVDYTSEETTFRVGVSLDYYEQNLSADDDYKVASCHTFYEDPSSTYGDETDCIFHYIYDI